MESKLKSMRLPSDLIEKIEAKSKVEERSFSQMVKVILGRYFADADCKKN